MSNPVVKILYYCLASISIAANTIQVIAILKNKLYRKLLFELILVFYISSIIFSFSFLLTFNEDLYNEDRIASKLCIAQSALISFFEISENIFLTNIAFSIYFNIIVFNSKTPDKIKKIIHFCYYAFGYGIPAIFVIISFISDSYGLSGRYCWLKMNVVNKNEQFNENLIDFNDSKKINNDFSIRDRANNSRFTDYSDKESKYVYVIPSITINLEIVYYFFQWITIIINFIICMKVILYIKKELTKYSEELSTLSSQYNNYKKTLLIYSLSPLFILLPFTINRTISFIWDFKSLILLDVFTCFYTAQGLYYTIIFSFNPEQRESLLSLFERCFNCSQIKRNSSNSTNSNNSLFSEDVNLNNSRKFGLNSNFSLSSMNSKLLEKDIYYNRNSMNNFKNDRIETSNKEFLNNISNINDEIINDDNYKRVIFNKGLEEIIKRSSITSEIKFQESSENNNDII